MKHTCHWPGCLVEVPPRMWGCRPHWFALPKHLRDKIWATYQPGQEITKTPSAAYIVVAQEVQGWCIKHELTKLMGECLEKRDGRYYATEVGRERLQDWVDSVGLVGRVAIKDDRYTVERN